MKKEKSILEEIEDFLEYLAKNSRNEKVYEKNLRKKFGKEKYERIYDSIGGKYTGGLPIGKGENRNLKLHISPSGEKYLEERRKERKRDSRTNISLIISIISAIATIFLTIITGIYAYQTYSLNEITSEQFDLSNRPILKITNATEYVFPFFKIENGGNSAAELKLLKMIICDKERLDCTNYSLPKEEIIFPKEDKYISSFKIEGISENETITIEVGYIWLDRPEKNYTTSKELHPFETSSGELILMSNIDDIVNSYIRNPTST